MKKQYVIDAPKTPVIRYRFIDERTVILDLRGIRNPHSPFNGKCNPSQGGGRKFLTPEHLQCMVDEYFESCNGPVFDKYGQLVYDRNGNVVKNQVRPYTVSGLALYLQISTVTLKKYREGMIDSILDEMKAETSDTLTFSRVILRARQKIEAYAECRLYDHDGQKGAQFVLDNVYGWVSRKEQADIKLSKAAANKTKAEIKLRQDEFDLKKKLLDTADGDDEITIRVVRGKKPDGDTE